jgi:uncharacterized protein (TIGR02597 family)
MKFPHLTALAATLLAALSTPTFAQSVATTPVGVMTYTFPATSQITTNYISIPLYNPSIYSGAVSSLNATTINFTGTPFTAGSLAQVGSPFFAKISSGSQAGRTCLIISNTVNSITLDTTDNSSQTTDLNLSGWSLAINDRIEIVPGDTLGSLFGINTTQDPLLFTAGTSTLNSDLVAFYSKAQSRLISYFFSTAQGYWRTSQSTQNQNNLVIYPENAIVIVRRSGRAQTSLTITGVVPDVAPLTKVTGSVATVYVGSRVPVDTTLAALSLTNWTKSNSNLTADIVGIYNSASGRFDSYFQRLDNNEWRRTTSGAQNQSNFVIPAGSGILLVKRSSVTNQNSFISSPLPYTL